MHKINNNNNNNKLGITRWKYLKLGFNQVWIDAWIQDNFSRQDDTLRSQNYANMVVGEHGIQRTFKVVVVVLSFLLLLLFDIFVLTSAHPQLILDKWFVQS